MLTNFKNYTFSRKSAIRYFSSTRPTRRNNFHLHKVEPDIITYTEAKNSNVNLSQVNEPTNFNSTFTNESCFSSINLKSEDFYYIATQRRIDRNYFLETNPCIDLKLPILSNTYGLEQEDGGLSHAINILNNFLFNGLLDYNLLVNIIWKVSMLYTFYFITIVRRYGMTSVINYLIMSYLNYLNILQNNLASKKLSILINKAKESSNNKLNKVKSLSYININDLKALYIQYNKVKNINLFSNIINNLFNTFISTKSNKIIKQQPNKIKNKTNKNSLILNNYINWLHRLGLTNQIFQVNIMTFDVNPVTDYFDLVYINIPNRIRVFASIDGSLISIPEGNYTLIFDINDLNLSFLITGQNTRTDGDGIYVFVQFNHADHERTGLILPSQFAMPHIEMFRFPIETTYYEMYSRLILSNSMPIEVDTVDASLTYLYIRANNLRSFTTGVPVDMIRRRIQIMHSHLTMANTPYVVDIRYAQVDPNICFFFENNDIYGSVLIHHNPSRLHNSMRYQPEWSWRIVDGVYRFGLNTVSHNLERFPNPNVRSLAVLDRWVEHYSNLSIYFITNRLEMRYYRSSETTVNLVIHMHINEYTD